MGNLTRHEENVKIVIIKPMEMLRKLDSMAQRLRKELGISLKQPLLDYAFGGYYLDPAHRRLLAESINIYDQGYDFADRDWYEGLEVVKPEGKGWQVIEDGGLWIGLNTETPDWLKKVYEKRCEERKEAMRRKKLGLEYVI